jgi:hypothetical protein
VLLLTLPLTPPLPLPNPNPDPNPDPNPNPNPNPNTEGFKGLVLSDPLIVMATALCYPSPAQAERRANNLRMKFILSAAPASALAMVSAMGYNVRRHVVVVAVLACAVRGVVSELLTRLSKWIQRSHRTYLNPLSLSLACCLALSLSLSCL